MTLSDLSIRRPVLATVVSILIVVIGIAGLLRMPVRELPDTTTAEVTVSVPYTGAGPGVVDSELATVIEGAISSVSGIDNISTESELGGLRTVITFQQGRDIDQAASDIRAAVQSVSGDLPTEAEEPQIEKNDSQGDPIMRLTMTSDTLSASELTDYADRFVTDRLETLSGVAAVQIYGDRPYAMRVWLDPDAMAARGVTATEVADALRANNLELPAGQIESTSRTYLLRTETRLNSVEEFEGLIVRSDDDGRVLLGDVTRVEIGTENDDSLFRVNGEVAVGLGVLRQSSANTLTISSAVAAEVEQIAESLPGGTEISITSDDADFISNSIRQVLTTLGISVAIVIAVIFLFLTSIRATVVPAVTIPIALVGTCAGIAIAGFSINTLTLFALILAIGLVVDDAIVVLENIERRIEEGDDPEDAARTGANQVFFAVVSTSAVLVSVFVPLSFLEGELGKLFREFGITLAIAVTLSTFVALTICPVIASRLLKPDMNEGWFSRLVQGATKRVTSGYRSVLTRAIKAPIIVLAIAAALSGMSWVLYQELPSQLTPESDRGVFFASISAPPGSALGLTDAAVKQVEALIEPYREDGIVSDSIAIVGQYGETGRAFVVAVMAPWGEREMGPRDVLSELRPEFAKITGVSVRSFAPSGFDGGGGTGLELIVTAPSFEQAADYSKQMADAMRSEADFTGVRRSYEINTPGYDIGVNRALAREIGVDARTISDAVRTFFASAEVTEFISRDRQYPVILQAPDDRRAATDDLRGINVRVDSGDLVPLDGLVTLERRASVAAYNRYNRQPSVEISSSLAEGVDLGSAISSIERIAEDLPSQMQISYSGQAESFQNTSGGIATTFALALLIVFLVLAAQFESFIQPVVILLSVPLAAAGALITLFVLGEAINIYTQVGMVMLIGLMAKNGILIVEFANQLRTRGMGVREAVIEAATVRLRPILMTVMSTVLGAVPLVLSSGAGASSRFSIGIVIIGGFLFASILTLFLTPVLYDLLQWDRETDESDEAEPEPTEA
ncbi:efflux RND transporter permease subunit [Salipiger sp. IMCC34102]|uniref:efflux RND transporter permease subunit n=1 Tax=Salipiger sp. IMCC34102 TaxID=2510647 RepID=UPI00101D990B|nr:efflux RND transporter permease subunit [Salipiger sp. IMCC34102]RYH02553.1 efflux RND transporter permease subunit [Salipiger sp. IMCC34102]